MTAAAAYGMNLAQAQAAGHSRARAVRACVEDRFVVVAAVGERLDPPGLGAVSQGDGFMQFGADVVQSVGAGRRASHELRAGRALSLGKARAHEAVRKGVRTVMYRILSVAAILISWNHLSGCVWPAGA